jgi:predicted small lipoprotein YifL
MSGTDQRRSEDRAWLSTEHKGAMTARIIVSLLLALMLVAGTMLKGCGYKGPLYLPDTAKQPAADKESKKKSKQQN